MNKKLPPSVFIGSSKEGHEIAKALQSLLYDFAEPKLWSQGVFGLSSGSLDSLIEESNNCDFAILVLTPDDVTNSRNTESVSPRDNVLFELGLFIGKLGKNRTYIVCDLTENLKIPSDLLGLNIADYKIHSDGNLESSLGKAAFQIEKAISKEGVRYNKLSESLTESTNKIDDATIQLTKVMKSIALSRKTEVQHVLDNFGAGMDQTHKNKLKLDIQNLDKSIEDFE